MTDHTQYAGNLAEAVAQHRAAKLSLGRARGEYVAAVDAQQDAEAAREIIQTVAATVQAAVHNRIAAVVGRCLTAVFDEPYSFEVRFVEKRGRTEANLLFIRGGMEIDPMGAAGGGVIDVAAFSLRLAALLLARPPRRRLLVLDEPWRFLSVDYRPRVAELLAALSEEMGVQFVIVTHDPALIPEGAVRVEL